MEKQIGKLYSRTHTEKRDDKNQLFRMVILCTGLGKSDRTISGVVVDNTDAFSNHHVGMYSDTWTWYNGFYEEYKGNINLNNKNWKEYNEIGDCAG